jgi:hypothetical protein
MRIVSIYSAGFPPFLTGTVYTERKKHSTIDKLVNVSAGKRKYVRKGRKITDTYALVKIGLYVKKKLYYNKN